MKILHIITDLHQGGAETTLLRLITTSLEQTPDVEHEVISLREIGSVGPKIQELGIKVSALGMNGVINKYIGVIKLFFKLIFISSDVIIQTWMYHADFVGGIIAKITGKNKIYWNIRSGIGNEYRKEGTLFVLKACAAISKWIPRGIIACGHSAMQSHVQLGYAADRWIVISNGFDTNQFDAKADARARVRSSLGVPIDALVVGTVARMHPAKDYITLAHSASMLTGSFPQVQFLWVGAGTDTNAELTDLVSTLGIDQHVIRLGLRDDISDLLHSMDIFCLSSRTEGFPNALGEAMASALPCVSTDAGDSARLLGDRTWIVPVGDAVALAKSLERLMSTSLEERHSLRVKNRARIVDEFSLEQTWKNYHEFYSTGL